MKRDQADNTRVVIVGAGSAGLAAAHALRRTGIAVRILDKGARVAETWRQRHPQLRLNTHRLLSGLPGLSMPASDGAFPRRDTVVHYLETYASRLGVPVEFGVNVKRVDQTGQGWRVQTNHRAFFADHVIFATGHDRVPHVPGYPGVECYGGETRHAAGFGDLAHYRNRKVLVVGAGNSGSDVLNHLVRIETDRLWVSIRHGPVVFPTRFAGIPVQLLSPLLEWLPVRLVDRLLTLTERVAFGDLSRWGMRKHEKGGATRLSQDGVAPAIDNGFVTALKQGSIQVVAAVESFEPDQVRLDDGSRIAPDIVVFATGYRTGLEQVIGHLDLLDERGVPMIHGAEQDPRYPGIWFTGMRPMLSGFFRAAGSTGKAIARAIRARQLSDERKHGWHVEERRMQAKSVANPSPSGSE
jgi:cation diffusion facilitator CzcD-associated flavoprotein CzcO